MAERAKQAGRGHDREEVHGAVRKHANQYPRRGHTGKDRSNVIPMQHPVSDEEGDQRKLQPQLQRKDKALERCTRAQCHQWVLQSAHLEIHQRTSVTTT